MASSPQTATLSELLSHSEWLRGLARRLVTDEAAADDLVQETWIAAMQSPPVAGRSPRPWLAGIARNLARMGWRGAARRRLREASVAKGEELPSTEALVEQVEVERGLAAHVLALDEPFRTTVLLRYFRGLDLAEIARRQGGSASTVRWRHARGIELLRERLSRGADGGRSWRPALLALARVGPAGEHEPPSPTPSGAGLAWSATQVAALVALLGGVLWSGYEFTAEGRAEPPPAPLGLEARGSSVPVDALPDLAEGRRSAAFAAAEPDEGQAVEPPTLRVHFADLASPEEPAGRRLAVVDAEGECHVAFTDESGTADFRGDFEGLHLYATRPDGFVQARPLLPGDREMWWVLEEGLELSGRAYVDGLPAPGGVELVLEGDAPAFGGKDWPDPVAERLFERLGAGVPAHTRTGAGGAFTFRGLPPSWRGVLRAPEGLLLDAPHPPLVSHAGGGELRVEGPTQGLELFLTRAPGLGGRALDPGGEPSSSRTPRSSEAREIEVAREGDCRLHVTLELPAGVWSAGLSLLVEAEAEAVLRAGSTRRLEREFGRARSLELADLRPGQPLALSILGPAGDLLFARDLAPLEPGDERELQIALPDSGRKLHVSVWSDEGRRLAGTEFRLLEGERELRRLRADRKAALRVDYLPERPLRVVVEKRGYLSLELGEGGLPGGERRGRVVLERARDVRLEGAPVEVAGLWAVDPVTGRRFPARPGSASEWFLLDVPRRALVLELEAPGRLLRAELPAEVRSHGLHR